MSLAFCAATALADNDNLIEGNKGTLYKTLRYSWKVASYVGAAVSCLNLFWALLFVVLFTRLTARLFRFRGIQFRATSAFGGDRILARRVAISASMYLGEKGKF